MGLKSLKFPAVILDLQPDILTFVILQYFNRDVAGNDTEITLRSIQLFLMRENKCEIIRL